MTEPTRGISEAILLGPPSLREDRGRYFFSERGFGEIVARPKADQGPEPSIVQEVILVRFPEEPWLGDQVIEDDHGLQPFGWALGSDKLTHTLVELAIEKALSPENLALRKPIIEKAVEVLGSKA